MVTKMRIPAVESRTFTGFCILPMIRKLECDLDIMKVYQNTENEVFRSSIQKLQLRWTVVMKFVVNAVVFLRFYCH